MSIRHLKVAKELLKLFQHVIIYHVIFIRNKVFRVRINCFHQLVSELGHHEKLLQHRVHVTDATKVDDSNMIVYPAFA